MTTILVCGFINLYLGKLHSDLYFSGVINTLNRTSLKILNDALKRTNDENKIKKIKECKYCYFVQLFFFFILVIEITVQLVFKMKWAYL